MNLRWLLRPLLSNATAHPRIQMTCSSIDAIRIRVGDESVRRWEFERGVEQTSHEAQEARDDGGYLAMGFG